MSCSQPSNLQKSLTLSLSNLLVQNLRARQLFGFESQQLTLGFRECGERMYRHECRSRTRLAEAHEQTLLYGCKVV